MTRSLHFRFPLFLLILLSCSFAAAAQGPNKKKKTAAESSSPYDLDSITHAIPRQRQLFHDRIDKEQRRADVSDGAVDGTIFYSEDSLYTGVLTQAIISDINRLQVMIENLPIADPQAENQNKIRYLQAVWNFVTNFNKDTKVDPYFYRRAVANLRGLIIARHEEKLDQFIQQHADKYSMYNSSLLDGFPALKAQVFTTVGKEEPALLIRRLKEFANEPFACDIIAAAASKVPNEVYSFASSTDPVLSGAVRRCNDDLVRTIVQIADGSKAPLKAMSFLSDIYNKRKTIAQIDAITADQDLFYKNLVRLKLEGETLGGDSYTGELAYRGMKYVRTMNDLHESPDATRFKCLDGMDPASLYFLMVYGQDEIYTSSFLGTFNRMMQRRGTMSGDSLLTLVRYDKFRTFIRLCANYNKLSEFLGTMPDATRNVVMTQFISNLEAGQEDDLEDAVDVADAFGSIDDVNLQAYLQTEVKNNYERVGAAKSKKGIIVYGLLTTLFRSFTDTGVDGTKVGLPPVSKAPFAGLVNDSGRVYEQFFFYGDEDGKSSYNSFLGNFKDGKWKQSTPNKFWTVFTSTAGKPVTVYANLPIPEPGEEEAQDSLTNYLGRNEIHPTIIVHRGHSYHLSTTIDHLSNSNKIVFLGSCGGYHNLGTVLERSPDGQIISTKQTGTMLVNDAIVRELNKELLAGNDIDWVKVWASLAEQFKGKAGEVNFREYVPPHRNLGAIFIKAYRRMNNAAEES